MANHWKGTPRNDRELTFWQAAYIAIAAVEYERERPGNQKGVEMRLSLAAKTADRMLGHFQTSVECMEDFQAEQADNPAA